MSEDKQTEVAQQTKQELILNPDIPSERKMLLVEREFAVLQRKAIALSQSDMIPDKYKKNLPNCMIAMEMANRLNTGTLEIMQNLYVVHGNPAFSSAYLIARVNCSGILKGRLKFQMVGEKGTDTYGCFAYGTDRETDEVLEGSHITITIAKAEGWYTKKGSKWPTLTDQMLMYRAAAFWSRVYAPDATMGMHSVEERQDIEEKEINPAEPAGRQLSSVNDMLKKGKVDKATGEVLEHEAIEEEPTPTKESNGLSQDFAVD